MAYFLGLGVFYCSKINTFDLTVGEEGGGWNILCATTHRVKQQAIYLAIPRETFWN